MERVLFGTDGVRGPAGVGPLAPPALARLGLGVAKVLRARSPRRAPRAFLGRDTRRSGPAVAGAFASGLLAGGVEVLDGGVLPTPAVAWLVRETRCDLGVAVSASHNPWEDNGIKLLGADGSKLGDAAEHAIERVYFARGDVEGAGPDGMAALLPRVPEARLRYLMGLIVEFQKTRLRGIRLVVDAANGAQSGIASQVLSTLGAEVVALHESPDGRNINRDCGALHTEGMRRRVRAEGAHLGIAFDGDADRVQLCDEAGRLLDGDAILAALAPRMRAARQLPGATVVGTTMTNGALEGHLAGSGIRLLRTDVGDRNVVAAMTRKGFTLGGEPSGHVLVPRRGLLTGDGLRVALLCLRCMATEGLPASALAGGYRPWPQEIVSLRTSRKPAIPSLPKSSAAIAAAERALRGHGRIVVRYSGTEPKVRVMVEAGTHAALRAAMGPVVAALEEEVGVR